jgi:glycosyltransferase involved in cell wall biosynthesis
MIRLGIDAINLLADDRGMGRLVRGMLQHLAARSELTLLVGRARDARAIATALPASIAFAPLRAARARNRFDAVWFPWNAIRFRTASPALVTIHDDFAFRFPARGFVARCREQGPIRRAVREADRLITISRWSRDAIAERFGVPPDRIGILPLAPNPIFFPAVESSPLNRPFVLVVAGSEPRKNLRDFAGIFGEAFPDGDVVLVVAGDPDRRDRRLLRRLGAHVQSADDAALRTLYRTARAVAVPSLAEGYGLVAAEAQACGAPVIASNASALPETVGEGGALVAPDDRAGWIATLRDVVGDEGRNARLRAAGVARWAFSSRDVAAQSLLSQLTALVHNRA